MLKQRTVKVGFWPKETEYASEFSTGGLWGCER